MSKYKHNRNNHIRSRKNPIKDNDEDEIRQLKKRIDEEKPKCGYVPPLNQQVTFRSLPISQLTLKGLENPTTPKRGKQQHGNNNKNSNIDKKYITMTDIQNSCIVHALAGRDILGAARTGSGKTLTFLIPILELLYRERFTPTPVDGVGAIVLSPTRELAIQIFNVLKQIGKFHTLSAGLIVGGNNMSKKSGGGKDNNTFYIEQQNIISTNIIIATPGRLLQHLEQTPNFDVSNLRILVLDEADRILDMGFKTQLTQILDYLPATRQTLLFSATQTRKISDLATLSLNHATTEYISVHEKDKHYTPKNLQQSMIVVPLEHKLNTIYSFIKTHLKSKIIIFVNTCSQVRYIYELFCSLQPGMSIMSLHGKIKNQQVRTQIYYDYINKPYACMFATDIAARGLDFPNIDWVVQLDCPEDKETYIHRVGRTARFNKNGKSLLLVTPDEEKGVKDILLGSSSSNSKSKDNDSDDDDRSNNNSSRNSSNYKIPIKQSKINPNKTFYTVTQRSASIVASNVKIHELSKKAFKSYVRSIYLMPNKKIFDVTKIDLEKFAESLGLSVTPNIRFLKKLLNKKKANNDGDDEKDNSNTEDIRDEIRSKKNVNHKLHKLKEQIKAEKLAKKINKSNPRKVDVIKNDANVSKFDDDDDLLVVKTRHEWGKDDDKVHGGEFDNDGGIHEVSKSRHHKKIRVEGSSVGLNSHVKFHDSDSDSEDGSEIHDKTQDIINEIQNDKDNLQKATEDYMNTIRERLKSNETKDRKEEKERIQEKHRKKRLADKMDNDEDQYGNVDEGGPMLVTLGDNTSSDNNMDIVNGGDEDDADDSGSSDSDDDSSSSSGSSSGSDEEDSDSDSDDSDHGEIDLKTQEEAALALIAQN